MVVALAGLGMPTTLPSVSRQRPQMAGGRVDDVDGAGEADAADRQAVREVARTTSLNAVTRSERVSV